MERKNHVCIYNMETEEKVSMGLKGTSGTGRIGGHGEGHGQSVLCTRMKISLQNPVPHTINVHQCLQHTERNLAHD